MNLSWKLGRIAGIDLFLHPTFFLLLLVPQVVQGGLASLALVAAAYGCVVLHELGHALTARAYGIPTRDITIYPIGGVARLERMPRTAGPELLIALAGPAVNLAIALVLGGLVGLGALGPLDDGQFVGEFVLSLLSVNIVLAVFNLIPAFPMDGGRVFRALLSGWLGRLRATRVAAGLGRGLAVLGGSFCLFASLFLGAGLWLQAVLAAFIYFAAGAELRRVEAEEDRPRHDRFDDSDGIWVAPRGYRWVRHGQGTWQLAPIVVFDDVERRRWR